MFSYCDFSITVCLPMRINKPLKPYLCSSFSGLKRDSEYFNFQGAHFIAEFKGMSKPYIAAFTLATYFTWSFYS